MMTSPQTPTSAIEDKGAVPQTPTSATTDAKETIILPSAPNQDITPPDATPKSLEVQPFTDETPQEFVHRIKKNYGIREDELDDKEKRKAKYLFLTKK
ncbi:MAG: hypothetical protein LBG59_02280 [Candidatus Peribacteria bacterium]|jgi:hypothetical protein|nr:hypothetical protein [Candidatus Peribacteria bacterium]